MILEPCPEDLPKIRNMVEGEARYALIIIRLLRSVTSGPTELAFCPVAALKAYDCYARCKALHQSHLFMLLHENGSPVFMATILAWVVKLLHRAYLEATELDACLAALSVHEIHALATSLTIQATFALWRSESCDLGYTLHFCFTLLVRCITIRYTRTPSCPFPVHGGRTYAFLACLMTVVLDRHASMPYFCCFSICARVTGFGLLMHHSAFSCDRWVRRSPSYHGQGMVACGDQEALSLVIYLIYAGLSQSSP